MERIEMFEEIVEKAEDVKEIDNSEGKIYLFRFSNDVKNEQIRHFKYLLDDEDIKAKIILANESLENVDEVEVESIIEKIGLEKVKRAIKKIREDEDDGG